MVITPKGVYAQVEFSFKIAPQSGSFSIYDSVEAELQFDLPSNSFIHNSWLWLDNNTIIQADLIDRGRAITIYQSFLKKRRDPSLLVKTGDHSYRLNVYPMTVSYPRKVKIVYSVPFNWLSGRVNMPLPFDILRTSSVTPTAMVVVKHDNDYSQPWFTEKSVANYVISSSGSDLVLEVPPGAYSNNDLTLNYHKSLVGGTMLTTYPTGNTSGIYQLVVDPVAIFGAAKPKHIVFLLDLTGNNWGLIASYPELRQTMRSFLLNRTNPVDSFNIFYVDGGSAVHQIAPQWIAADSAGIEDAFDLLPGSLYGGSLSGLEHLAGSGMAFCHSKTFDESELVLISNNSTIQSQAEADTAFNHIKAYAGGLNHKLHIINNTYSTTWIGNINLLDNELLYSKLSLATDGNYFRSVQTSSGSYSLDIKNILNDLYGHMGTSFDAFSIALPLIGGFAYSRYDINRFNRLSASTPYVETGKYTGTIQSGSLDIQLLTASGYSAIQLPVNPLAAGAHSRQAWTLQYLEELSSLNSNGNYTTEMIDSSMETRVLCDYTAFLALETGDTIAASMNEHGPGGGGGGVTAIDDTEPASPAVKCYPNPFRDELFIEFTKAVEELTVYDITGRMVFRFSPAKDQKQFSWNGRDNGQHELPAGLYIIRVKTKDGVNSRKVMKQ